MKKNISILSKVSGFLCLFFMMGCQKEIVLNRLEVGQRFQGGIILYVDETGQHGLIVAEEDQGNNVQWYNGLYTSTGALETQIGSGKRNTALIVQAYGDGNFAAKLCDDLVLNGFSDWFLPSRDELDLIFKNELAIKGLSLNPNSLYYWSSSEYQNYTAWIENIGTGQRSMVHKSKYGNVRAVREF